MEVCVDCVESAINAFNGGAQRIELCSSLATGGLTPSVGLLQIVKKLVTIPVFVMIRPRSGDFLYSHYELDVMKEDIVTLKRNGADGFVIGILDCNGRVNKEHCKELIDLIRPMPVTFHRAIDVSYDCLQSLEDVISLGCERVLTSGGQQTAVQGATVIRQMIELANGRIIVMPGSGVTETNLDQLLKETRAVEFHGSARSVQPSRMTFQQSAVTMSAQDDVILVTDSSKVKTMVDVANMWKH